MMTEMNLNKGEEREIESKANDNGKEMGKGMQKNYQAILGLMAAFGYVSAKEIVYGFDLTLKEACHRLEYLLMVGLIDRFPDQVGRGNLYCLSLLGRDAVRHHRISNEILAFRPYDFHPGVQRHHRTLIQVYLAMKKILGLNLLGWVSEGSLKKEAGATGWAETSKGKRILDGEFFIRVEKTRFRANEQGELKEVGQIEEDWRCGLELELSLKSARRYETQFQALSRLVWDKKTRNQHFNLVFFLCGDERIEDRLIQRLREIPAGYGQCIFLFGQANSFLSDLKNASLKKFLTRGPDGQIIESAGPLFARELNHVRVKVNG